jgi:hypothetical protein
LFDGAKHKRKIVLDIVPFAATVIFKQLDSADLYGPIVKAGLLQLPFMGFTGNYMNFTAVLSEPVSCFFDSESAGGYIWVVKLADYQDF